MNWSAVPTRLRLVMKADHRRPPSAVAHTSFRATNHPCCPSEKVGPASSLYKGMRNNCQLRPPSWVAYTPVAPCPWGDSTGMNPSTREVNTGAPGPPSWGKGGEIETRNQVCPASWVVK